MIVEAQEETVVIEKPKNICPVCQGAKQVKKRMGLKKYKVSTCPNCYGTGKLQYDENQIKSLANAMVANLLENALDVGFHLEKVNELNHDLLLGELFSIQKTLEKEGFGKDDMEVDGDV